MRILILSAAISLPFAWTTLNPGAPVAGQRGVH